MTTETAIEHRSERGRSTVPERTSALVWAFRIHPDGRAESLDIDALPDISRPDGLLWLHFNLANVRAAQWLTQSLPVPPEALALLLSKDNYQQLHVTETCVYGVLSDLVRDLGEATEDIGYLHFLMTEHLFISGRHQALCAVDATRHALEKGQRVDSSAGLLQMIVEHLAVSMDHVSDRIAVLLDDVEEKVLSGQSADGQHLGQLRRTCVRLHRQLSGLRLVFHRLEEAKAEDLPPALRPRTAKFIQRFDALDHTVIEMRERTRLLQEEVHLQIEAQDNRSLRALSVMTALLLPPTLVTGVFGMNVKGLPLTDGDSGFFGAMVLVASSSACAYWVLKRIGLIR